MTNWWENLDAHECKGHSQTGEEGIIDWILQSIGDGQRIAVDLGAGDGYVNSNVRFLADRGWRVLMVDGERRTTKDVVHAWITAEGVADLLRQHGIPEAFDFLSLDLDGVDYWILRALLEAGFKPRLLVCEINGIHPRDRAVTIPYRADFRWPHTNYYGASLAAFEKLGAAHGLRLVHVRHTLNAFFVRADLVPEDAEIQIDYVRADYHGVPWVEV